MEDSQLWKLIYGQAFIATANRVASQYSSTIGYVLSDPNHVAKIVSDSKLIADAAIAGLTASEDNKP